VTVSGQTDQTVLVRSVQPVTLVGGGRLGPDDLDLATTIAPDIVAVDGGAGAVLDAALSPLAVIGDMDSLTPEARHAFADRLHPIAEQETTDFDKALHSTEAPLCVAIGFSGGRFDHELAVLNALLRHADRPCLVLGSESLTFLCPPRLDIAPAAGSVFSLFPLVPVGIDSQGLLWPTAGLDFRPDGMIGTSNSVTGPVSLTADRPGMLVILPRDTLPQAVSAIRAAPRWPA
jgi:thiamine pyrophosphokinase